MTGHEQSSAEAPLGHLKATPSGYEAQMVDVSSKASTHRTARARARIRFPEGILDSIWSGGGPTGPVQEVARVAGIQAAKRTSEWIPMCHPLSLRHIEIGFTRPDPDLLEILCSVACEGPTGVEMEALLGASAAALTVYDMSKGLHKGIVIEQLELLEKSGGRSGSWRSDSP